jgi:hypothetical protein
MSKRDREYYLARIAAEREAAECAASDAARSAHLQLAERYEQWMAGSGADKPPADED